MSEYSKNISTYADTVNEDAVSSIVSFCGIALQGADSSLVASSDPNEIATVRDGFAAKKLGLSAAEADAGIAKVVERMKGENRKHRVTFYYLLAEETGTLHKLA